MHRLPFPDDCFGSYLSFGVLEHFEHGDAAGAPRSASRAETRRRRLLLTIPYPNVPHRALRIRRKLAGRTALTNERFYESAYSRRELEALAAAAGFEVELAQATSHEFTLWGFGRRFPRAPATIGRARWREALGGMLKPAAALALQLHHPDRRAQARRRRAQLSYAGKIMQQS